MSKDYFSYYEAKELIGDKFRISASQFSKFFDSSTSWFRENLMGETGFTGNTASELGTCVHAGIQMWVETGSVDHTAVNNYIDTLSEEFDKEYIRYQYPFMVDALISQYFSSHAKPHEMEKFIYHEVNPGIVAGGSIDGLIYRNKEKTVASIIDFKTHSSKTPPTSFSRAYWFQQMLYAWVLSKQGILVDTITLVFVSINEVGRISEKTGKPMKDYPSEVTPVSMQVTPADLELIEGAVKVCADSVTAWNEQPSLRYLLAKDYRLKQIDTNKKRPLF